MYTYQIGNQTIDYKIKVVPNKTDITVQICDNEGVTVIIPRGLNEHNVRSVISRKATWILKQLNGGNQPTEAKKPAAKKAEKAKAENKTPAAPKAKTASFENDDKFSYLGRQYRLNIVRDNVEQPEMTFRAKFIATVPSSWSEQETNEGIQNLLTEWYQGRANEKFSEALKAVKKQAADAPDSVAWKELQDTYATMENGELVLNWRLLLAPLTTIEYVIASQFTDADSLFEDAAERKQWLEENSLQAF
ncbi:M48 family metallopeptidase [Priestia flexa]|uniref:M48 family metallopeptidase n=1 Tax=Priestia flexa TaxID=86664 RepID=UPI0010FBE317|nr:YgjP-like metallopeptidase domain-containing protein [Priestia flexa]QCS53801.1 M48 family metallopeptidase [Priestia flexa]